MGEDFALVQIDKLYRCLDKLLPHKEDLFTYLKHRWQALFAQNLPVIMLAKPMAVGAVWDRYGNYLYGLGVIPGYNPVPLIFQK